MKTFDPYRDWLEIDPELLQKGPPNYYQLIGIAEFAEDPQTIVRAVDRTQAKVRSQRPGGHAADWARLLDELKQVRETLTNDQQKQSYDARLRGGGTAGVTSGNDTDDSQAPAPQEVSAPEATSTIESTLKQSATAWPPGMAPPGVAETPSEAAKQETVPEQPVPQPTPTANPVAPAATDNNPIPLSARWPAPDTSGAIPSSVGNESAPVAQPIGGAPVATPYQSQPPEPPATKQSSAPMAVPLSALHSTSAPSPTAMPTAAPTGSATGEIPTGSAVPSGQQAMPDPMAPLGSAKNQSIPVGTAVASQPSGEGNKASLGTEEANELPSEKPRSSVSESRQHSARSNTTVYLAVAVVVVIAVGSAVIFGGFGSKPNDVAQNNPTPEQNGEDEEILRPMTPSQVTPNQVTPQPDPVEVEKPVVPDQPTTPDPAGSGTNDPDPPEEGVPPDSPSPPAEPMPNPPPPEPTPPEPTPPEPMPTPPVRPNPKPVTDAEIAELSKLLTAARQALTDKEIDVAKQSIEQAISAAKAPAHMAKARRLESLVFLVSEFWRAVDESLKGLDSGEVISISNTQVSIVEVTPEKLIIRVAGVNRTYNRADMSEGLAMGLANRWLDQTSEVTPLVKGAFYAVAKQGDAERAREQWSEAAGKGADVGDLPDVLTDKYDEATLRAEAAKPMANASQAGSLSPADKQALAAALRSARDALTQGSVDDADAQLTIARNIAGSSELLPVVARTEVLAKHVRVFWNAVAEGMANLGEGTKLNVGNTEVVIKESSRDQITYSVPVAEIEESVTRSDMGAGLAMAIAKTALPANSAETALARGAFYAVARNGSSAQAREAWNEAGDSPDLPALLKTLDDTYEW